MDALSREEEEKEMEEKEGRMLLFFRMGSMMMMMMILMMMIMMMVILECRLFIIILRKWFPEVNQGSKRKGDDLEGEKLIDIIA